MRILTVSALAAGLTLAGCATDPNTGQQTMSKAGTGALIGAAAGALIGNANGGRKDTIKGAAIGAALGGGVGYYMDEQEKKLRQQMAGTGVDVQKDEATGALNLVMPGNITFAFNSSNIAPQFQSTLSDVAGVLSQYDKTTITVEGHTDSKGGDNYNQRLSQQRAASVAGYLASNGVAIARINTVGMGETDPIASNDTETGRSQNRRVEIRINPPSSI